MKHVMTKTVSAMVVSFLAAGASVLAAEVVFEPAEGARAEVLIEGTSTVTDWEVEGNQINGRVVMPNGINEPFSLEGLEITAEVEVPSESLESGRRAMNSKIRDALDVRRHPNITFELNSLHERPVEASRAGAIAAVAEGNLTIAGATRLTSFPVEISLENGELKIDGEVELQMTTFDIDPPRAMLGALRTGDEITVSFVWVLERVAGE